MVSNGILPDFFWISQDTNVGFCCLLCHHLLLSSAKNGQKICMLSRVTCSHLFPIHIIYVLIFPIIRAPGPRYKWVGKSLYIFIVSVHWHIAIGIFVHSLLNWTPCIWYHDLWSTTVRIRMTVGLRIIINIASICTIYMLLDVIWN
jgi:hypothetical protein